MKLGDSYKIYKISHKHNLCQIFRTIFVIIIVLYHFQHIITFGSTKARIRINTRVRYLSVVFVYSFFETKVWALCMLNLERVIKDDL